MADITPESLAAREAALIAREQAVEAREAAVAAKEATLAAPAAETPKEGAVPEQEPIKEEVKPEEAVPAPVEPEVPAPAPVEEKKEEETAPVVGEEKPVVSYAPFFSDPLQNLVSRGIFGFVQILSYILFGKN